MGEALRSVWEELGRIAQAIADRDQPMSAAVYCSETIPISIAPAVTWDRLFDEGLEYDWRNPATAFDPATGRYTIPQEGVWQVIVRFSAPASPTPANKGYYLALRVTITYADGRPQTQESTAMGGTDDLPLAIVGTFMSKFAKGDSFVIDGASARETVAGTVSGRAVLEVTRVSGAGNNTTA
jgi:acetylornithine deacetylase/succinyl-diaminopimelate desuccinylase-like protein